MTEPKTAGDETSSRVPGGVTFRQRLFTAPLLLGLLGLLALTVLSLLVGVYDVFGSPDGAYIFALTRIPRTVSLLLAGSAMAISGLVMQQMISTDKQDPRKRIHELGLTESKESESTSESGTSTSAEPEASEESKASAEPTSK